MSEQDSIAVDVDTIYEWEESMWHARRLAELSVVTLCLAAFHGSHLAKAANLFQDLTAAWNTHDPDKVSAMFTDDAVYEDVALGIKSHGTAEIRKFAKFTFDAVPDIKIELTNSFSNEGHGYMEWVLSGTDVGVFKTNKAFSVRGASIVDTTSGKVARNLDYYDLSIIMKQEGLLPAQAEQASQPGTTPTSR